MTNFYKCPECNKVYSLHHLSHLPNRDDVVTFCNGLTAGGPEHPYKEVRAIDPTLEDLTYLILSWAQDRNLIEGSTAIKQYLKLGEELGETAQAMNDGEFSAVSDGFGDMFVVLTIMSAQLGSFILHPAAEPSSVTTIVPGSFGLIGGALARGKDPMPYIWAMVNQMEEDALEGRTTLTDCVLGAWNEIKDRKGRMVDGVFVKEGEPQ